MYNHFIYTVAAELTGISTYWVRYNQIIKKPFAALTHWFYNIVQINLDHEVSRQRYMISQFMNVSTFKGSRINRVSAITDATGPV